MHTVVMLRHGESLWNVENRFTGWCDVPLTAHGEADAIDAGTLMGERGLKFDVAFTSNLERGWRTCAMTLAAADQSSTETIRSSMLNERHYGALQGHKKDCPVLIDAFGIEKMLEWRRSYGTAPPSLSSIFTANAIKNATYAPSTESLAQCEHRAFGYWQEVIAPRVRAGERVLIVAHANTIRALVKAVDNIDDQKIAHLKIPNGIPLVYTMDERLQPIDPTDVKGVDSHDGCQATYLVSARNHSKVSTPPLSLHFYTLTSFTLTNLFPYLPHR
ncbi:phosphoglycerate mutase 1 family protein [Ochromonadaceae sp. CCMP2298]|nr:phosphoglycerate mutase 1 family protein [Ochromonadaceae sp. CCMP2298]